MPLVLDGTNGVSGVDGTASNPAIEGTDSNTGIFYPAADTVAIGTGGTEALRVNSSQQVGIGTTSILGNSVLNVAQGVVARNSGATLPYFQTYNSNAGTDLKTWRFGGNSSGALTFETVNDAYSSATGRMTLDASGNLGVGVSSPGNRIDVSGNQGFSTASYIYSYAGGSNGQVRVGVYLDGTNNVMQFFTSQTERARITSGGNLGVGITSPAEKIDTDGTVKANAFLLDANFSTNNDVKLVTTRGDGGTNTVQVYWNNAYGAKAASGCLGAYSRNGTYFSPGTTISASIEYTIYGFIGVSP